MIMRLQKYIASSGVASRRKAEKLIIDGKITVNGNVVTKLGTSVDSKNDVVKYKGDILSINNKHIYIMLNKPEGFITTVKDQFNRPSVTELLKGVNERVFPVGRLDYNTSGLLILTNDGDLTYRLTHPKHEIKKTYLAKLFGTPDINDIKKFKYGLDIDGKKTLPANIEIVKKEQKYSYAVITIKEGRNRQIRKMCEQIKHPVATLKRIATGDIELGELKKGKYRYLTDEEIKYLKNL